MRSRSPSRLMFSIVFSLTLILGSFAGAVTAQDATPVASPVTDATPVATPEVAEDGTVDLDVLFVGAHPDDEAGGLGTYGQWNEFNDAQVGVITITRGEGGGNASGTEEGPALGLLREVEERNAIGMAGIQHLYNLDEVDFYYTVSAELTAETWGYEETLEKVVRVIRTTQPEVLITMNPAPTPGQHGHHQMAGRLAIHAFYAAADPEMFPDQIESEGLETWRASRIMRSGASGEATPGPQCAETFQPQDESDVIFGVWNGTESEIHGTTWADIERKAQQSYVSQGWGAFPDAPTDPEEIGCDYFTLIDSRAPFDVDNTSTTAILEGAVIPVEGGLPLGSEFYLTTESFDVSAGEAFEVTAHLRGDGIDESASVELALPVGWEASDAGEAAEVDGELQWTFEVTPAEDADTNQRYRIGATVTAGEATADTIEVVHVAATVDGTLEPLPEVAYFREWVDQVDVQQLDALIFPVFSMGSGQTRDITVTVTNSGDEAASGTVSLALPEGFSADSDAVDFNDVDAGGETDVTFTITNDDTSLATSNEGGEEGTYAFTITTTTDSGESVQEAGINLVPVTTVPLAGTAPDLDGEIADGEYTGEPIDLSRVWEGEPVDSPEDGSGSAWVTYDEEGLYIAVDVTDDTLGTVLPEHDAKRHWRTDSVEIAIDPLGTASNTSATFKVGVFPTTEEGEPAAYRDADNFQGPVAETAPGFEVASSVSEPYTGYVLEVFIPYDALPATIDPDNATMNIFIYDSDTQDLTGQTRLGWSTWRGVQGDPYRWGKLQFETFGDPESMATPQADASPEAEAAVDEPQMPLDVAESVNSPWSILQSARDGVGLGGNPQVPEGEGIVVDEATSDGQHLGVTYTAQSDGDVRVFHYHEGQVLAQVEQAVTAGETYTHAFPSGTSGGFILISFVDEHGHVQAIAEELP